MMLSVKKKQAIKPFPSPLFFHKKKERGDICIGIEFYYYIVIYSSYSFFWYFSQIFTLVLSAIPLAIPSCNNIFACSIIPYLKRQSKYLL